MFLNVFIFDFGNILDRDLISQNNHTIILIYYFFNHFITQFSYFYRLLFNKFLDGLSRLSSF